MNIDTGDGRQASSFWCYLPTTDKEPLLITFMNIYHVAQLFQWITEYTI